MCMQGNGHTLALGTQLMALELPTGLRDPGHFYNRTEVRSGEGQL